MANISQQHNAKKDQHKDKIMQLPQNNNLNNLNNSNDIIDLIIQEADNLAQNLIISDNIDPCFSIRHL